MIEVKTIKQWREANKNAAQFRIITKFPSGNIHSVQRIKDERILTMGHRQPNGNLNLPNILIAYFNTNLINMVIRIEYADGTHVNMGIEANDLFYIDGNCEVILNGKQTFE